MKKMQNTKKGFTLIELLVVITIIGILATGATATYTSQIQRARDSTRITDLNAMRSWIEQVYQAYGSYPDPSNDDTLANVDYAFSEEVLVYMESLPKSEKSWEWCGWWTPCDYLYMVWEDDNNIKRQRFNINTWLENKWTIESRAKNNWFSDVRLEIWISIWGFNSSNISDSSTPVIIDNSVDSCGDSNIDTTGSSVVTPTGMNWMVIRWNCS